MNIIKNIKVETIFLVLALIFGLLFLTLNPPFQVQDESEHYDKTYAISEGNILTGTIIELPKSVMEMKLTFPQGNFSPGGMQQMMRNGTNPVYGFNPPNNINLQKNQRPQFNGSDASLSNLENKSNSGNLRDGAGKDDMFNKGGFSAGFSRNFGGGDEYKTGRNLIKNYIFKPLNPDDVQEQNISAIANYPPASYIGSATGMFVGRLFNCSALMLLYIGRLVNLLIYITFIYFAIKIIPVKKYVLLLLGLIPTALFEGSSLSADSLTIAASYLIIAYFFKLLLVDEKIKGKDIVILSSLTVFLLLSKQIYAGLALLFFMIPRSRFTNIKERLVSLIAIFIPAVIVELLYSMVMKSNGYSVNLIGDNFSTVEFVLNLFSTLKISLLNLYIPGVIGSIGYHLSCPVILSYLFLIVLVITTLLDYNKYKLNLKTKIVPLITFLVIFVIIFLMVSNWSMSFGGSNVIGGLQPRYFIPIIPLLFIIINFRLLNLKIFNLIKLNEKYFITARVLLIVFIVSTLSIATYSIYTGLQLF
jgi:uncharacterized membrane protein